MARQRHSTTGVLSPRSDCSVPSSFPFDNPSPNAWQGGRRSTEGQDSSEGGLEQLELEVQKNMKKLAQWYNIGHRAQLRRATMDRMGKRTAKWPAASGDTTPAAQTRSSSSGSSSSAESRRVVTGPVNSLGHSPRSPSIFRRPACVSVVVDPMSGTPSQFSTSCHDAPRCVRRSPEFDALCELREENRRLQKQLWNAVEQKSRSRSAARHSASPPNVTPRGTTSPWVMQQRFTEREERLKAWALQLEKKEDTLRQMERVSLLLSRQRLRMGEVQPGTGMQVV